MKVDMLYLIWCGIWVVVALQIATLWVVCGLLGQMAAKLEHLIGNETGREMLKEALRKR